MNLADQQSLMVKFSRCEYVDDGVSYEQCDCVGAVRIILRDFYGKGELPEKVTDWTSAFEMLDWPTELIAGDVLLIQYANRLDLVDHMAVYIGNGNIAHLGKHTGGMICQRLSRYENRIKQIARVK